MRDQGGDDRTTLSCEPVWSLSTGEQWGAGTTEREMVVGSGPHLADQWLRGERRVATM